MEKKKGRKPLGLSDSAKKLRKKEQDRSRQQQNKSVLMNVDTHARWVSLAERHGITSRELAVVLLDAVDEGKLPFDPLDEQEESRPGTSSQAASSSGQQGAAVTPGTCMPAAANMSASYVPLEEPPQHFSTPLGAPWSPSKDKSATMDSGSDARSAISGIEELGGNNAVNLSDDGAQAVGGVGEVEASGATGDAHPSDDNLDVSVLYKVDGSYVYLEDLEDDDDDDDKDYDFEAELALSDSICEGLPVMEIGEEVFELREKNQDADTTRSGLHHRVQEAEDAAASKFLLIEETELIRLAERYHQVCPTCEAQPLTISVAPSGSAGHIHWTCPSGHRQQLCTQRTVNRVHTGDLKMSAGLVISGNNYAKIAMFAEQAGFGIPNRNSFHQIQSRYVCPAVQAEADAMMAANVGKHAENEEGVVLLGDGRNDSPGHTAQYLTYVLMEETTGDIVHAAFKDKRQAGRSSVKMEPLAFFESIELLEDKGLTIKEVVTDAHSVITAQMRTKRPAIKHSHDVWHGGKNLGKKLTKISSKAANRPLIPWTKDVINHWWYCSQTCENSETLFKEKWRGLLHHVVNEHEWAAGTGKCGHDDIQQTKDYLEKGSPPHAALAEVVMDRMILKKIPYYVNFRHTGELESVNNHILMYCSKRFSFRYPGYKCRNQLALIDYQHHKDREVVLDEAGNEKYVARWSKRANDYVAVKCRVPKKYEYLPGLMKDIMLRRLTDDTPLRTHSAMEEDDPRRVAPRLAPRSPPPVEEILRRRHVRRF